VRQYYGSDVEKARTKEAALAGRLEVVVTSYATMRGSIASLAEVPFHAGARSAAGPPSG
jgi:hypothetical protein